jgi:hypothetical protein
VNRKEATTAIGTVWHTSIRSLQAKDFHVRVCAITPGLLDSLAGAPTHLFIIGQRRHMTQSVSEVFKALPRCFSMNVPEELMSVASPGEVIRALRAWMMSIFHNHYANTDTRKKRLDI